MRHDEYKESEVGDGHHPHYDKDVTTPVCDRCHIEITSLNCATSRAFIPRKRLTTWQRLCVWRKYFIDGLHVFVRGAGDMRNIINVDPDAVLSSVKWLGAYDEAKKMKLTFPHRGMMKYEITDKRTGTPITVLHIHESALIDEKNNAS